MRSTSTKTDLKTARRHTHYRARCGVQRLLQIFRRVSKKQKRKLQLEREDECEETSPHNGQGNEPAPRQCAQRAWLHGGRVDSDGGVGQRCVGRRRAQEGRSVRGWCWLPGALILGAACAGLRHHHRDTGGAPAPECRPSGVGSLLLLPPPPPPLLARARALSLSADPHAADSALAFFPRNVARGHAAG